MTSFPAPSRADHLKFCQIEGWAQVRSGSGSQSHPETFELHLADGRILRTRISHPPGRQTYGPDIWSHILLDQLGVDESVFWACVNGGVKPARTATTPPKPSIPANLIHLLIHTMGIPEEGVREMTRGEAIERAQMYWSSGETT